MQLKQGNDSVLWHISGSEVATEQQVVGGTAAGECVVWMESVQDRCSVATCMVEQARAVHARAIKIRRGGYVMRGSGAGVRVCVWVCVGGVTSGMWRTPR